jgi:hypothetical protein
MLMEEDDRLENLAAKHAVTMDSFEPGTKGWFEASDRYLRTLESRAEAARHRPAAADRGHHDNGHDDPATVKMKAALAEAQKRKDAALADIQADTTTTREHRRTMAGRLDDRGRQHRRRRRDHLRHPRVAATTPAPTGQRPPEPSPVKRWCP